MRTSIHSLFFSFVIAGVTNTWSDDADRLRELESITIETNQVKQVENSELLEEHLESVQKNTREATRRDVELAKIQQASEEQASRVRLLKQRLQQEKTRGGEVSLAIQRKTTRQLIEKEFASGAGEAFKNSFQYWTEEGFYNAGFSAGWTAGNEIFDDRDRVRIPFAPHHGRRSRE